ncbi:MAG: hypothetical protein KUG82_00990 [Pseudomonadales bacterium]|nr:hypothetical protein [Pseudomonadales bacterium]
MLKRDLVFIILVTLITSTAAADTINGTIKFLRKPPLAGLFYVDGITGNKRNAELDQKNRKFTKDILVLSSDGEIVFSNSDDVDHNIYANDAKTRSRFDVGLMVTGIQVKKTFNWPEKSMIRIGCKIHPKMKSYIVTTDNSLYTTFEFRRSDGPYSFSLTDIPNDQSAFTLMIPKYEPVKLTLNPGESKSVPILKKGKEKGSITIRRD